MDPWDVRPPLYFISHTCEAPPTPPVGWGLEKTGLQPMAMILLDILHEHANGEGAQPSTALAALRRTCQSGLLLLSRASPDLTRLTALLCHTVCRREEPRLPPAGLRVGLPAGCGGRSQRVAGEGVGCGNWLCSAGIKLWGSVGTLQERYRLKGPSTYMTCGMLRAWVSAWPLAPQGAG